jgi:hypothetical protein
MHGVELQQRGNKNAGGGVEALDQARGQGQRTSVIWQRGGVCVKAACLRTCYAVLHSVVEAVRIVGRRVAAAWALRPSNWCAVARLW